jgi:hypothetical protein
LREANKLLVVCARPWRADYCGERTVEIRHC